MPTQNKPLKEDWENFESEVAFIILHRMETTHDMEYLLKFIRKYFKKAVSQTKSQIVEQILDFPKLIKDTRKQLGENQTKFGARFGLPHHSISYYESGTYEAPYSVIQFCIRLQIKEINKL